MKYCTNCGNENSQKICGSCGVRNNKKHLFCGWCGKRLGHHRVRCPRCHTKIRSMFFSKVLLIIGIIIIPIALFLIVQPDRIMQITGAFGIISAFFSMTFIGENIYTMTKARFVRWLFTVLRMLLVLIFLFMFIKIYKFI